MSLAVRKTKDYPSIVRASVSSDKISVSLSDGREVSIPLAWSQRLLQATPEQRANLKISPTGYGIHWPDVDEDLCVKAFLD